MLGIIKSDTKTALYQRLLVEAKSQLNQSFLNLLQNNYKFIVWFMDLTSTLTVALSMLIALHLNIYLWKLKPFLQSERITQKKVTIQKLHKQGLRLSHPFLPLVVRYLISRPIVISKEWQFSSPKNGNTAAPKPLAIYVQVCKFVFYAQLSLFERVTD